MPPADFLTDLGQLLIATSFIGGFLVVFTPIGVFIDWIMKRRGK